PRDPSGAPIVAPTFSNSQGNDPQWPGWKYVPTASDGNTPVLSVFDQQITIERKIHSGSYRVIPPTDGGEVPTDDVIEFSVVDKDDILGLFGELGLTVGVDVLELKKWVINEHVDGNVRNQRDFYGEEVFPITQGLYVRTGYTSTGAHVPTLFVTLKDYIE
ncbi:MAG: hypothetical protein KAJ42_06380, partial [Gemmatimonadetes bacterium]|nr:hypothetical protein [Gemmatimonadota bacterium]